MAYAGDEPSPAQIEVWERQLASYATKPDARDAARRALARLKPSAAAAAVALRLLSGASPLGRVEGARVAQRLGSGAGVLLGGVADVGMAARRPLGGGGGIGRLRTIPHARELH